MFLDLKSVTIIELKVVLKDIATTTAVGLIDREHVNAVAVIISPHSKIHLVETLSCLC